MFENFKKILGISITVLLLCQILLNPHFFYDSSPLVLSITNQINAFCLKMNFSYCFSNKDILSLFRFLEYFVFGIMTAAIFRVYSKKIYQNIINSMFLGLLIAVLEVYFRNFGTHKLEVQDILYSFFEFCIGLLIIFIIVAAKPKKSFLLKNKRNNYIGRS